LISEKLRELRKNSGLTLLELAEKTGLSTAYLSNVERDRTSPTINNLFKICKALNADITAILSKTSTFKTVIRKNERKKIFNSINSSVKYELTSEGTGGIVGVCITIPANHYEEVISMGHDRDELGVVATGSLAMYLDDQEHILEEGDSIFIKRGTSHWYKKIGDGACISYWSFAMPQGAPESAL